MKEHLLRTVERLPVERRKNAAREHLQARILGFIQEKRGFASWIFHGGTALRFLYELPRYSEDLDFSLAGPSDEPSFREMAAGIGRSFQNEGYAIDLKFTGRAPIATAFVRFPGLPRELGLSPHPGEILAVKIEVDTRPPAGGGTETTIIRRHILLNLLHYDRPTLFAGKLHAFLCRPHVKGRDLYDLFWYLSDRAWPEPNLEYLQQALRQTQGSESPLKAKNWRQAIAARLNAIDWRQALADVRPFIERSEELDLLTLPNLKKLLG